MRSKISFKTILSSAAFLLVLFPYVTFVRTRSDVQPWACIVAFVCLIALFSVRELKKIPKPFFILVAISAFALVRFGLSYALGSADLVGGIRSLWGYASVIVFALLAYWSFSKTSGKLFIIGVWVWTFGAAMQLLLGVHILDPVLTRLSTDAARGLTSFAPEPAFYAALSMACIVLNEFFYARQAYSLRHYALMFALLIAQMTLAASGVGLILLATCATVKIGSAIFAKTKKSRVLALGAAGLIALSLIFQRFVYVPKVPLIRIGQMEVAPGAQSNGIWKSRAASIISQSLEQPAAFIHEDTSTRHRLFNGVMGFYGGIVQTKGLGMGIASKNAAPIPAWLAKLIGESRMFGGRIEGGISQVVYELGIIGCVYALALIVILARSTFHGPDRPALILSICTVFGPYFLFGTISFPLFGYLLGIHLAYCVSKSDSKAIPWSNSPRNKRDTLPKHESFNRDSHL